MELREYLSIIRKRLWIVIVITVFAGAVSAGVSFFVLHKVYQSTTSLYVGRDVQSNNAIAYSDLLVGDQLVKDYRELVKSRKIAKKVIDQLHLNITPAALSAKLSVSLKNDTRLIEIIAQDEKPELARNIAQKVAEAFSEQAVAIMKVDNVQIIDVAELPTLPVKPQKELNISIATLVGLLVGLGIVFLIEYLDNTIKTPEDIRKYLELPVIGTIITFPE